MASPGVINTCVLALAVGACTEPPPNATLADLPAVGLAVQIGTAEVGINRVTLFHGDMINAFPDDCPILDSSLVATFGDRAMTVAYPGGKGESDCEPPELEIDSAQGFTSAVVEVSDRSLTISATFTPEAMATRTASHPSWTFVAGEPVTVDWSPASDLAVAPPVVEIGLSTVPVTVAGGQISFVAPAAAEARITITAKAEPGERTAACVNAASCIIAQERRFRRNVVIQP
jgi:hypothetical protein